MNGQNPMAFLDPKLWHYDSLFLFSSLGFIINPVSRGLDFNRIFPYIIPFSIYVTYIGYMSCLKKQRGGNI